MVGSSELDHAPQQLVNDCQQSCCKCQRKSCWIQQNVFHMRQEMRSCATLTPGVQKLELSRIRTGSGKQSDLARVDQVHDSAVVTKRRPAAEVGDGIEDVFQRLALGRHRLEPRVLKKISSGVSASVTPSVTSTRRSPGLRRQRSLS